MVSRIDTPEYWIDEFKPTDRELETLYENVLETMRPQEIETLAAVLVRDRVSRLLQSRRTRATGATVLYRPTDRFELGQKLLLPALDGAEGVVVGMREGNNPGYGPYEVIALDIGGARREFAAGITFAHHLTQTEADVDPDAVVRTFAPVVAPGLAARLASDKEWLVAGHRWVLRALLPKINAGHRNLAEAIVMLAGEPLPSEQILTDLDLDNTVPIETRALALDIALADDDRFRNVGAIESPLWTLKAAS
jgi:hypothetical protein